jgi:tripartite-type tricarboxylate transporter receptor subunit TctC
VPNVPTLSESGLENYVIEPWFGVVAPAGVPRDIVAKLNGAVAESLKASDVRQRLSALGYEPIGGSADDFARTIRADIKKYATLVKKAGISGSL